MEGDGRPVVLLANIEENPVPNSPVRFVRGDPTKGEDLERANIKEADAAIIFPTPGSENPDAQSLLTALAIETINPDVYTCVEIADARNKEHFSRAHVDEVIAMSELGAHLLARSTIYKGLATLVSTLLYNDEDNELYKIPLPDHYVNKTFDEVLSDLRNRYKMILLAIERGGETIINPQEEIVLQEGDHCLIVAWEKPSEIWPQ
jgi:voltage-gated potassium channel